MLNGSKVLLSLLVMVAAVGRAECPPAPAPAGPQAVPSAVRNAQPPAPVSSAEPRVFGRWPVSAVRENANTRVFANGDTLIRIVQFEGRQVVAIFGALFQRDWDLARQALETLEQNKRTIVLTLFGGGTTGTVRGMISKFREKCPKETCELQTQVLPSTKCASNCITMFMMGDSRLATPASQFGFHSATLGKTPVPGYVERIYGEAGVSGEWLRRNHSLFSTVDVTYLTPVHLEDSNIVTNLVNSPGRTQASPQNMCSNAN